MLSVVPPLSVVAPPRSVVVVVVANLLLVVSPASVVPLQRFFSLMPPTSPLQLFPAGCLSG